LNSTGTLFLRFRGLPQPTKRIEVKWPFGADYDSNQPIGFSQQALPEFFVAVEGFSGVDADIPPSLQVLVTFADDTSASFDFNRRATLRWQELIEQDPTGPKTDFGLSPKRRRKG